MAMAVKPGFFASTRSPKRTSCKKLVICSLQRYTPPIAAGHLEEETRVPGFLFPESEKNKVMADMRTLGIWGPGAWLKPSHDRVAWRGVICCSWFGVGPFSVRAGHVNDDAMFLFGGKSGFLCDGGEGAKEQVASIGHDGSAAGRDSVLSLEN